MREPIVETVRWVGGLICTYWIYITHLTFTTKHYVKHWKSLIWGSEWHLEAEVKWAILVCCLSVKWPGLITVHYPSARCHNKPCGVTGCGVVAFLAEETKMQCTIGCDIWPTAHLKLYGNQWGMRCPAILNPSETETGPKYDFECDTEKAALERGWQSPSDMMHTWRSLVKDHVILACLAS